MLNIAVVGNRRNEANRVLPSCTVHLDSRSVVGIEALWVSSLDQTTSLLSRTYTGAGADITGSAEVNLTRMKSEMGALIIYTSGTTGRPKGALHTHAGA